MAINNIDGIIAGMKTPHFFAKAASNTPVVGRMVSYWATAGIPGPGSFDTTLAGVALSSTSALVDGQIPYYNPTGGLYKYLARAVGSGTAGGILFICDRLWHNGGITITSNTAQTVNSATFPSRDNNGSTNGEGVLVGVEVSAAVGAGTPTLTLGYTNSGGTASRSGTNMFTTAASSVAGTFYQIGLQAGDLGVRSIQNFTLSATWTSGTINLVAYRILAAIEVVGGGACGGIDPISGGLPRLFDGTVPFLLYLPSSTTPARLTGQIAYTEG